MKIKQTILTYLICKVALKQKKNIRSSILVHQNIILSIKSKVETHYFLNSLMPILDQIKCYNNSAIYNTIYSIFKDPFSFKLENFEEESQRINNLPMIKVPQWVADKQKGILKE